MNTPQWFLIVNPMAGNGRGKKHWPKIQQTLQEAAINYDYAVSSYAGQAIELAQQAVEKGFRYIASVGGDGTANEVINGICQQETVATDNITFAIIPVGTGNDWIKTHGIPKNYKKAIELLPKNNTIFHDIGKVYYHNSKGDQQHRFFMNVAGLAYDAYVTKASKVRPSWGNSQLYYFYLIATCVATYKPSPMKIIYDGKTIEYPFYNVTIGQCIYNGGGTQLVPHADPQDGLFAMTVFKDIKSYEVITKSHRFYNGSIVKHKEAMSTQAKHLKIEASDDQPAYVEVDGEYLGRTPIEFIMLPKALKVIVP